MYSDFGLHIGTGNSRTENKDKENIRILLLESVTIQRVSAKGHHEKQSILADKLIFKTNYSQEYVTVQHKLLAVTSGW